MLAPDIATLCEGLRPWLIAEAPAWTGRSGIQETAFVALEALAHRHDVAPLLRKAEGLPPEPDTLRGTLAQLGEVARLASLFEQAGVRLLVLKGPLLALRLYGDVTRRVSHDIDLLVAGTQIPAAVALLERAGYGDRVPAYAFGSRPWRLFARHRHELKMTRRHQTVELHWRLTPVFDLLPLAFEDLWKRRYIQTLGGAQVATLGDDDLTLHLVVHAAREGWGRLKWVCDLVPLLGALDAASAARVDARFTALGLGRLLAVSYGLLHHLFGLPVPVAAAMTLTQDRDARWLLARVLARYRDGRSAGRDVARPSDLQRLRDDLSLGAGWSHLARTAQQYLFDANTFDHQVRALPRVPPELHYVLRPLLYARQKLEGRSTAG